jgi:hypothetical protein
MMNRYSPAGDGSSGEYDCEVHNLVFPLRGKHRVAPCKPLTAIWLWFTENCAVALLRTFSTCGYKGARLTVCGCK